jgi:hypothetical protein
LEWLILIPPVAVALLTGLLLLLWFVDAGYTYIVWALNILEEHLQADAAGVREKLFRRKARKRAERLFSVAAGGGGTIDHDAVEAAQQLPVLRRLLEEVLPDAIVHCLRIHRKSAGAVGALYILEVAYEPECNGSRQRVVGLAATGMGILERYPYFLEDENLMSYRIVLRTRVLPVCSNCPYLQHRRDTAPLFCPTAETLKIDWRRISAK